MSDVRVRFAPSPTGFFHIGSARTALFNWLYARHVGGAFILRIEDTDKARNTAESLRVLIDGMRWLGLDWDEGPEVGGDRGPYFQSERGDLYAAAVERLKASGRAYEKDGAVFFRLVGERYREFDTYLNAEVEKVRSAPVRFNDVVRGSVERVEERDFPIVRSNGEPVFHLVNVVDDIEMGITHVIRGEDHLTNTTKHLHLFEALGATVPTFAHLPLILKDPKVGKGKMSKRDQGALIEAYVDRDFIPGALVNFLALLGWSPKDNTEYMTVEDLIARFDLAGVQKGAARFDEKKLEALNTEWIHRMPFEDYQERARAILVRNGFDLDGIERSMVDRVLGLAQEKVRSMEGLPELVGFAFADTYPVDEKAMERLSKKGDPAVAVERVLPALEAVEEWNPETISGAVGDVAESLGEKPFAFYPALRMAVSGQGGGPDLMPLLAALGRVAVLGRLREFRGKASSSEGN